MIKGLKWETRRGSRGRLQYLFYESNGIKLLTGLVSSSKKRSWTAWLVNGPAETLIRVGSCESCRLHLQEKVEYHIENSFIDQIHKQSILEKSSISVDVLVMETTALHRHDYYVRIMCGERSCTPHMFRDRYKAEYETAHYQWIFGLREEEPDILAYDETTHPNFK